MFLQESLLSTDCTREVLSLLGSEVVPQAGRKPSAEPPEESLEDYVLCLVLGPVHQQKTKDNKRWTKR